MAELADFFAYLYEIDLGTLQRTVNETSRIFEERQRKSESSKDYDDLAMKSH